MSSAAIATDFLEPPREQGEIGRLGPYRVVGVLGRGGMGLVYRAEDSRLQRTVALKVMNKSFAATLHARQRFIDEARSMAAVHHDNVATIFEVAQKDNTPFMAMELLQGQTLEQAVQDGRRFSSDEVIAIADQTAAGLSAAHARGITHRDIKPANLWIQEPTDRIKILDFGLALAGSGVDQLSEVGSVIGTPGYLAPEQARTEPVDARTDLYSLGVVLYELVCGRLPLVASSVASHLVAIICHEPQTVNEVAPEVPRPLADFIMRLLSKEPRDRIASAELVRAELVRVKEEIACAQSRALDIVVAPEESRSRRTKALTTLLDKSPDLSTKEKASNRFKVWPIATSALSALIIFVGVYVSMRPNRVAQKPMPISSAPAPKVVTAEDLTALGLEDAVVGNSEVLVGEIARFQVQLTNQSKGTTDDPRVQHRSAKHVAKLVTYLKRDNSHKQATNSFPLLVTPSLLPGPGETKTFDLQFSTLQLPQTDHSLLIELQSPDGTLVDSAATQFRLSENLVESELLGFEFVRTLDGSGADTSLAPGAGDADSKKPAIELQGGRTKKVGVIRFDLRKLLDSPRRGKISEIDRAVLLFTVAKDSYQSRSAWKVYGWPSDLAEQQPSADQWLESSISWASSPMQQGAKSLTFLDDLEVDNASNVLREKPDQVRFVSARLDDFVRSQSSGLVTLVILQNWPTDKICRVVSKDADKPNQSPGLAVRFNPTGGQR